MSLKSLLWLFKIAVQRKPYTPTVSKRKRPHRSFAVGRKRGWALDQAFRALRPGTAGKINYRNSHPRIVLHGEKLLHHIIIVEG